MICIEAEKRAHLLSCELRVYSLLNSAVMLLYLNKSKSKILSPLLKGDVAGQVWLVLVSLVPLLAISLSYPENDAVVFLVLQNMP